ncbi:hypothetical protein CBOM_07954 [Ceraceosorus bombacis]|uniref:Uncharacterized protein n=1 Tax=Ceraceosorus bombacis TaxID=401625 RepID=A0A0P1BRK6_9BASI|nr:hypothetical protein CBOM_07954 [Ceraceosorus bombacis]
MWGRDATRCACRTKDASHARISASHHPSASIDRKSLVDRGEGELQFVIHIHDWAQRIQSDGSTSVSRERQEAQARKDPGALQARAGAV